MQNIFLASIMIPINPFSLFYHSLTSNTLTDRMLGNLFNFSTPACLFVCLYQQHEVLEAVCVYYVCGAHAYV